MDNEQTVLVVDDAPVWRRLLTGLLTQWGYCVYEAEDGEAALALLAAHPINLVLSDWEMPVMDGVTLCRAIRERFQDRYIYLVLLTARDSVDDLRVGFSAGADDFLRKPVNQIELQARLHAGARILQLEMTLATRNARLTDALKQIELDLQAAARLQSSILPPHALRHGSWEADWLFLPSAWVSGDVFNFFPLDDRTVAFYSVDVSGHGVSAAMMSVAVARQFTHGRTVERFLFDGDTARAPREVVHILNQRFCAESDDVLSYFTLVYGVIACDTGEGVLCQAGHPTPFIVARDGALRDVGLGGPPVGLFTDLSWEDTAFRLAAGERLCLYSDGIAECESASGEMFGGERLRAFMAEQTDQPLPALFSRFARQLDAWQASEAVDNVVADDISLLVIQRTQESEDNNED